MTTDADDCCRDCGEPAETGACDDCGVPLCVVCIMAKGVALCAMCADDCDEEED